MFYLMKMSHSLYTVASELISLSCVSVRGKRGRQECFLGGSQNIITLKKERGGNLLQLYLQKDFRFQKLGITGRRFPTISDDHVYTLLSASF